MTLTERFLKYVSFATTSDDTTGLTPSTPGQMIFANYLVEELKAIGLKDPNSNGQQQMDEPDNIGDAGWYNCQINPVVDNRCDEPTRPGGGDTETSVVIDGHTCFSDRLTCIFDNLDVIESGDVINIELGNGEVIKYATRKVETVYLEDIDMNEAMRPIDSDKEGLLLITCSGTYNGATDANGVQTASQRMLVYAVREE